jgi:hypothetical protein
MIKAIMIEDNFNQAPQRNGELKPMLDYFPVEIIDDPMNIKPDFIIYEVTNSITKKLCWYEVHVIVPSIKGFWGDKQRSKTKHIFTDLQSAQNFISEKLNNSPSPSGRDERVGL